MKGFILEVTTVVRLCKNGNKNDTYPLILKKEYLNIRDTVLSSLLWYVVVISRYWLKTFNIIDQQIAFLNIFHTFFQKVGLEILFKMSPYGDNLNTTSSPTLSENWGKLLTQLSSAQFLCSSQKKLTCEIQQ